MRSSLPFFRIFPPPQFMLMPHAGLDISDDGVHFILYSGFGSGRRIEKFGTLDFPPSLFVGGDVKREDDFVALLAAFAREHGISTVKVSIPEEKAYLFQTDVPTTDQRSIQANIEFKLEENVPLAAPDAVFYFDLLPRAVTGGNLRASVSVVPRSYIEHYTRLLASAGLEPVSFETAPKGIARSIIHSASETTRLIIHLMKKKTGIYITSGNVIHFTFTAPWGVETVADGFPTEELHREVTRIRSYWISHGNGKLITEAMLVGLHADSLHATMSGIGGDMPLSIIVPNVWENSLSLESYVPVIPQSDSLEYAVAAGLAFDTPRSS